MQDLILQEKFELEVLEKLNSKKLLSNLIFTGGTMMRLCYGMPRFSTDLDFWITKDIDRNKLFKNIRVCLAEAYKIKDSADKHYTLLFEVKSERYPRSLKIEIRKESQDVKSEPTIAYSIHSDIQVLVKAVSPEVMMERKIIAFLDRKEIRDVFDIEFLFKRGVKLNAPMNTLERVAVEIDKLKKNDYAVKLGSLLEGKQRKYYVSSNFKILKSAIEELKNNPGSV